MGGGCGWWVGVVGVGGVWAVCVTAVTADVLVVVGVQRVLSMYVVKVSRAGRLLCGPAELASAPLSWKGPEHSPNASSQTKMLT